MDREAEVIDAAAGRVLVPFEPGDTDRAGLFVAEFEVQWSDGRRETYPTGGYLKSRSFLTWDKEGDQSGLQHESYQDVIRQRQADPAVFRPACPTSTSPC